MPKICYIDKKFSPEHTKLITLANEIIASYHEQGYDLTLRQIYYQMVARDIIANTVQSYKRLGCILDDARLAGLIDWTAIIDRTRNLRALSHWSQPSEVIESAAASYRTDKWRNQKHRAEVWVEKDALVGVVGQVCDRWDVPYFSCRGYTSSSEMWAASQRLKSYTKAPVSSHRPFGRKRKETPRGQTPIIFHLGDHDPSGKDMTRDIIDRLTLFMGGMEIDRLALNMDQIELYDPPPNPAKITDSRARAYIAEFGEASWELDALEPSVIDELIESAILGVLDRDQWDADQQEEEEARTYIETAAANWTSVVDYLQENHAE